MPETPDTHPSPDRPDRTEELLAAAATGDLGPTEAEEYAALVAADPALAEEVASLRAVLARLDDAAYPWEDVAPGADLADRVLAVPHAAAGDLPRAAPPRRRRRRLVGVAAATAAAVLVGGVVLAWPHDPGDEVVQGPVGTPGVLEPIEFAAEPAGVDIDASLVAHTWGTETVLRMDGFVPGDRYAVVLRANDGHLEQSGGFVGSREEIDCRLNAALLREDVDAVEIRSADGAVVASSDVATVGG